MAVRSAAADSVMGMGRTGAGSFSLTRGYSSAKWKLQPAIIKTMFEKCLNGPLETGELENGLIANDPGG